MPIFRNFGRRWREGRFKQRLKQVWGTAKELSGYGDTFDRLKDIWKPKQ